jgi:hypothetical protein
MSAMSRLLPVNRMLEAMGETITFVERSGQGD